jgi:hypothetical protein
LLEIQERGGAMIMEQRKTEKREHAAVYAYAQHNVNYFGLGACKDEWED